MIDILITIDAEGRRCGDCLQLNKNKGCDIFCTTIENDERCAECLAAQDDASEHFKKYKELQKNSVPIFKYEELSDSAKEKARQWWTDLEAQDEWHEPLIETWTKELEDMGFNVPTIYFRLAYCQGDGACFTSGPLDFEKLANHLIMCTTDEDEARKLAILGRAANNGYVRGHLYHTGHYYHENSVNLADEYFCTDGYNFIEEAINLVDEFRKDLCRKLYNELQEEWEHISSEEVVAENITINDYHFFKDGSKA